MHQLSTSRRMLLVVVFCVMTACAQRPAATQPPPPATQPPPPATNAPAPTATPPPPPTITPPPPPTATRAPDACRERPVPQGKAPGRNEQQPGGNRLRIVRATDMQSWSVDLDFLIDQSATPSLTVSPTGLPLLYMTAHAINGKQDGFAVSVGDINGRTWRHCYAELINFPAGVLGVDPDVVRVAENQYRIYLTGGLRQGDRTLGIHYADSTDGITWQYGGIAFESDDSVIDSMTFKLGDTWHMYVLPVDGIDMIHATSTDGISFVQESRAHRLIDNRPHVLSHTMRDPRDEYKAFVMAFEPPGRGISMVQTSDGTTFERISDMSNPVISLADGDVRFTRDPAIVALGGDTAYLLVYATAIP